MVGISRLIHFIISVEKWSLFGIWSQKRGNHLARKRHLSNRLDSPATVSHSLGATIYQDRLIWREDVVFLRIVVVKQQNWRTFPPKKGVECVFVCFCAPFFWGGVVFGGYSRVDVTYQLLIALMFSSAVFARYFSRISLHWMSMCQSASRYCSESCRIICMQYQDSLGGGLICLNMFHPYLGKYSNLTNIFQMGWNHQPVHHFCIFLILFTYVGLYMLSFFESFDYHFFPSTT